MKKQKKIEAFLSDLAPTEAAATQNQAFNALLFFDRNVIGNELVHNQETLGVWALDNELVVEPNTPIFLSFTSAIPKEPNKRVQVSASLDRLFPSGRPEMIILESGFSEIWAFTY